MRSIKQKLFISFSLTIFFLLTIITISSIIFIKNNKVTKSTEFFYSTNTQIQQFILDNNTSFEALNKQLDLTHQFLFIFKNEELIFSNQTQFRTDRILDEILYCERHQGFERHACIEEEYDDFDEDYIERDEYIFTFNFLEEQKNEYEIYLGIDEQYLDQNLDDIYIFIIALNIVVFLILVLAGYLLINKTVQPLKLTLEELTVLRQGKDLTKRLNNKQSNDEFDELVNSLNQLLEVIEKKVKNAKQFSSDASHELKTPLTIIQGEIDLIKTQGILLDEYPKVIEKIDIQQKKLQDIIKTFLLLARLDEKAENFEEVSLDLVVFESIESNLHKLEEKKLELELDIEENLRVNFNEKYLYIVINNLITNAIKYTNEGSITIVAKKEKEHTIFEILDTGIGINKSDLEHIFERFYRVDKVRSNSSDGVGLGLSIVKKICESFNCSVSVSSTIYKGSSFKIIF